MRTSLSLDDFIRRYAPAPKDRKQAALEAADRVLTGTEPSVEGEPLRSLKDTARSISYHYSTLHRLGIQKKSQEKTKRHRYALSHLKPHKSNGLQLTSMSLRAFVSFSWRRSRRSQPRILK